MTQTAKGQFIQYPIQIIYERKDLNRDDKWVLMALMGKCWSEEWYGLSYREIASLADVPIALLNSYDDKKTGKHREGIMDRLIKSGDIDIDQGKEIDPLTGKPRGQKKTYIRVNYTHIWQQNAAYCEAKKLAYSKASEYQSVHDANASVHHANTSYVEEGESVHHANESVHHANESVHHANESVHHANESVHNSRSNVATYITLDTIDKLDKVDVVSAPIVASPQTTPLPSEKPIEESPKKTSKPKTTRAPKAEKLVPLKIELSPEEQAFYDLHCSMPWVKIKPTITEKVKEQCGKLAPHLKTQEDLYSLKNFMAKKQFFKDKGMGLNFMVMALNDWAFEQATSHTVKKTAPTSQEMIQEKVPNFKVLSTLEVALMPLEQRKAYNAELRRHLALGQAAVVG